MATPSRRSERRMVSPLWTTGAVATALTLSRRLLVLAATGNHLLLAPLVEDLPGARVGLGHGVFGRQRAGRGLGEHVGQHVRVEDLALGGVAGARIPEVRRPGQRLREERQLVRRRRAERIL